MNTWLARHPDRAVSVAVTLALVLLALVFRAELVEWFGGPAEPEAAPAPRIDHHHFDEATLGELREGLRAYEQVRAQLAMDSVAGVAPAAERIASAFDAAVRTAPPALAGVLAAGRDAASALSTEADVEAARGRFAEASRALIAASEADPRLREGRHVFECPMTDGFGKWIQISEALENPYMGTRMLQCGSETAWSAEGTAASASGPIAYHTCAMHPSVRQDEAGACPICGMDLTPVSDAELASGVIVVDDGRRQRIGLRTEAIEARPLTLEIRALGRVAYDETRLSDVSLRMSGWVERLRVSEPGQEVRRGQVLLTLYSPELYAAQLEYLSALRSRSFGESADGENRLATAARQRLVLLGMTSAQVDRLRASGEALERVPIVAPASGFVIDKDVVEGAHVEAGTRVYRIASLDEVWVEADLYEGDLPHVRPEQVAVVTLPAQPGERFEGRVAQVYPYLDDDRRTGRIRVELDNRALALLPDMIADVSLIVPLGERLAVPAEAVLYTGPRRVVFVDLGEGRLRPQVVELGARAGDHHEVRSGLSAGDAVVTSGTFLVASESRLRSSLDLWAPEHGHAH